MSRRFPALVSVCAGSLLVHSLSLCAAEVSAAVASAPSAAPATLPATTSASTASSAAVATVSEATSTGLVAKVIPLTEADMPKGQTADERKASDQTRDRALRVKCKAIPKDTFEKYQCERPPQLELQSQLADLLKQVASKTPRWAGIDVPAAQQQWEKQRDACHKDKEVKMCLEFAYLDRIGELQAQFGLVAAQTVKYQCGDTPVALTFHATNPPIAEVVKGDEHQLAWMHPVDGGVNYHGPAVSVREGKDGIDLQWHDSKLTCQRSQ